MFIHVLFIISGGESIHHEFRLLSEAFSGMENNPVGRLKAMLKRHRIKTHPEIQKDKPVKVTRGQYKKMLLTYC